jgi:prepilin-type N-terminal cleavage/methylation domain-containing protein
MNLKQQTGFTMFEMVVSITILGIIAAVTAPMFSQGLGAAQSAVDNLHTLDKLRYATERLVREIRQVNYNGAAYDISTMTASAITFTKDDSAATQVSVTTGGGLLIMAYSTPAASGTLTDEVSGFSLAYYDSTGAVTASAANVVFVEITLTLTNTESGAVNTQRTRVGLRDRV